MSTLERGICHHQPRLLHVAASSSVTDAATTTSSTSPQFLLLRAPLWYILLRNPQFRDLLQEVIASTCLPAPSRYESRPASAASPSRHHRSNEEGLDAVRAPVADVVSTPLKFRMWLSKVRWLNNTERYLQLSHYVCEMHNFYSPDVFYNLVDAIEDSDSSFQPPKYTTIIVKPQPVVPHLEIDMFLRSKPIAAALSQWWEYMPKARAPSASLTTAGSASTGTNTSGAVTGEAVSKESFLQLHVALFDALLYRPQVHDLAGASVCVQLAMRDWETLVNGKEVQMMGPSLFRAALMGLIEPWMETFQVEEREQFLAMLHPQVFAAKGRLVRLKCSPEPKRDASEEVETEDALPSNLDVLNKLVDRVDVVETNYTLFDGYEVTRDVQAWRRKLRLRRDRFIKNDDAALHKSRIQVRAPTPSENYVLEKVLFERMSHNLQKGEVVDGHSVLDYVDRNVIPEEGMRQFVRRQPGVVDRFRAIVEVRNQMGGAAAESTLHPTTSVRVSQNRLASQSRPHYSLPKQKLGAEPGISGGSRAGLYFRQSTRPQLQGEFVKNGSITGFGVVANALPSSHGIRSLSKLRSRPRTAMGGKSK